MGRDAGGRVRPGLPVGAPGTRQLRNPAGPAADPRRLLHGQHHDLVAAPGGGPAGVGGPRGRWLGRRHGASVLRPAAGADHAGAAARPEPVRGGRDPVGERRARAAGQVGLERRGRDRGHGLLRDRLRAADQHPVLVVHLLSAPGPAQPGEPAGAAADAGTAGAAGSGQPGRWRPGPRCAGRGRGHWCSSGGRCLRRRYRLAASAATVGNRPGGGAGGRRGRGPRRTARGRREPDGSRRGHSGVGGCGAAIAGMRDRLGCGGTAKAQPGGAASGHRDAFPRRSVGGSCRRAWCWHAAALRGDRTECSQAAQPRPGLDHQRRS